MEVDNGLYTIIRPSSKHRYPVHLYTVLYQQWATVNAGSSNKAQSTAASSNDGMLCKFDALLKSIRSRHHAQSKQPIYIDANLVNVAQYQANYMEQVGYQTHDNDIDYKGRLRKFGVKYVQASENVFDHAESVEKAMSAFERSGGK
ncbi:hypothetical protein IWQ62_000350 [Dispira parvispora]|uniref:Uncharacterized protein n=1 Tax=Dispira parvispora TaxID=1520584 RepID=A0A9W8E9R2_9FUNG|nr:hypothetical protein IWQ62_000350 [Dispira parvispora]